jgi:hypothetical protein
MATTLIQSENAITSKAPASVLDAQIVEATESPVGSLLEPLALEEHTTLVQSQGPLTIGQPVYFPAFGSGEIAAIDGGEARVRFADGEKTVKAHALLTLAQAEVDWHENWLRGEPWILEDGRRLSIVKDLCRYGEYETFLKKYDRARSTCDAHIRRYKNAVTWAAQDQQLARNGAIEETEPTVPDQNRKVNPRAPDPGADERKAKVEEERKKRTGRRPSHHRTDWSIRIKLPEEIIGICRAKYKEPGAKDYWRRAAFAFIGLDPDAPTQPDTTPAPTTAATTTEEGMPNLTPPLDDVAADVIDLLRDEGVPAEDLKRLQFSPGSDFNAELREATKQLKHNGKRSVSDVQVEYQPKSLP